MEAHGFEDAHVRSIVTHLHPAAAHRGPRRFTSPGHTGAGRLGARARAVAARTLAQVVTFAFVVVAAIAGFTQGDAAATPPAPTVTALSPTTGPSSGGTSVTISGANLSGATGVKFGSTNATGFSVSPSTFVSDSFDRTVSSGWGTADTGGAWTLQKGGGTTGAESVSGGLGAIGIVPAYYTQDEQVLTTPTSALNLAFSYDIYWPQSVESMSSPVSDYGGILGGIVARFQNAQDQDSSYYKLSASWDANGGSPQLELRAQSNGTTPAGGAFRLNDDTGIDPTVDYPSGGPYGYEVAGQITGTDPTTFAMKIWKIGTTEPTTWMLTGSDTSNVGPQVAGLVGFRADDDLSNNGGSSFLSTTGTVDVGALSVTPLATTVTATSPPGSGTVDVTVTTPGGTSATSTADQFAYSPGPRVTSVCLPPGPPCTTVASGPPAGGTSVIITGTGFTGATGVTFGPGNAASTFTVNSTTQITATSPPGSGTVDVQVTTPAGTSMVQLLDQYTYAASLTLDPTQVILPADGSMKGAVTATAKSGSSPVSGVVVTASESTPSLGGHTLTSCTTNSNGQCLIVTYGRRHAGDGDPHGHRLGYGTGTSKIIYEAPGTAPTGVTMTITNGNGSAASPLGGDVYSDGNHYFVEDTTGKATQYENTQAEAVAAVTLVNGSTPLTAGDSPTPSTGRSRTPRPTPCTSRR